MHASPYCFPLLFLRQAFLLFHLEGWANKLLTKNAAVSAAPSAKVTGSCYNGPGFEVSPRGPNSDLHASRANTLPIGPLHQRGSLLDLVTLQKP